MCAQLMAQSAKCSVSERPSAQGGCPRPPGEGVTPALWPPLPHLPSRLPARGWRGHHSEPAGPVVLSPWPSRCVSAHLKAGVSRPESQGRGRGGGPRGLMRMRSRPRRPRPPPLCCRRRRGLRWAGSGLCCGWLALAGGCGVQVGRSHDCFLVSVVNEIQQRPWMRTDQSAASRGAILTVVNYLF